MITLTFPWLVFLVALLFVAILVLMYHLKSPIRKWVCFGLSFVSIAYLLYIMMWHQDGAGQPLDWYLLGGVGILAALVLAGVGFMDLVKPITNTASIENQVNPAVLVTIQNEPTDTDAVNGDAFSVNADDTGVINADGVNKDVDNEEITGCKEEASANVTEAEEIDDVGDEIDNELKDDAKVDAKNDTKNDALTEEERIQREELIGKVMPWFLDQLNQYGEKEKNAIKVCAIDFVNEDKISSPETVIENNALYSQSRIIQLCSAFYLIGKDKDACVTFIKEVFKIPFANTEETTIGRKINGSDKMLEIIDSYWEAQGIMVKN